MNRTCCSQLACFLALLIATGCSHADSNSTTAQGGNPSTAAARPADPAAGVAFDFLDAVFRGEIQQASTYLTPKALQRLIENRLVHSDQPALQRHQMLLNLRPIRSLRGEFQVPLEISLRRLSLLHLQISDPALLILLRRVRIGFN